MLLGIGVLALATVQRLVLATSFAPSGTTAVDWVRIFACGLRMDLAAAVWGGLVASAWLCLLPERWFAARWHRTCITGFAGLVGAVVLFGSAAEWFFFEEFDARFNAVAVDYLLYPREVATTIWQDYPAGWIIAGCVALGAGIARLLRRPLAAGWSHQVSPRDRLTDLALVCVVWAALGWTAGPASSRVTGDRVRDELAANGSFNFVHALITRRLDHPTQYVTLPAHEALSRARKLLAAPGASFVSPDSIVRRIAGDPSRPRRNVVVILVESFGSEFVGALGRSPSLTPRFDALAGESWLFTNLLANGDRTQRGLEGVLSSFPPLPGGSIYRRPSPGPVSTLASVLKRDGYRTLFCYGGDGGFDSMQPFLLANGFDRMIERGDYARPEHVTIWGVSDEDLLFRALDEMAALHASGSPLFTTILTVSNHKPYTYPAGRIAENPQDRNRVNAVKYTDWALGEFFARAKGLPLWNDTIFVVIADHGPKVYGSPLIPLPGYAIPLVIAGPCAVSGPRRIGTFGSSLDVAPTVLGLIGRPYESVFFGRDLLRQSPAFSRALVSHNRDTGLVAGDRMAILSYGRRASWWAVEPRTRSMRERPAPDARDRELAADTAALLQVADELYGTGRYSPEAR